MTYVRFIWKLQCFLKGKFKLHDFVIFLPLASIPYPNSKASGGQATMHHLFIAFPPSTRNEQGKIHQVVKSTLQNPIVSRENPK